MKVTILIPCLNEQHTIAFVVDKARRSLILNNVEGEVLVADNGSTDLSVERAEKMGARVIHVEERGYGAALIAGTKAAEGDYIIMGDADDSYDFFEIKPFLDVINGDKHYDLIMGNRFKGGIDEGAMPFLHRYLGTPVLSFIGRFLYHNKIGDYNCGMRCYDKQRFIDLDLQCPGMEYASEMIIQASLAKYDICEVPIKLHKDKRDRPPHLNTWSDGWRHLKILVKSRFAKNRQKDKIRKANK